MDPVERTVSRVLAIGIAISVVFMLVGLVLALASGDGMPTQVVSLGDLVSGLGEPDAAAYISLGLLALVATPFVRVAGCIVAFALERDRRYVLITAAVLAVMCVGVLLGRV
jgi:uncharacterized membrane protein